MKIKFTIALAAAALVFGLAQAATVTIDFQADPTGAKPNGYSPIGHPGVTLTDTIGADLSVFNGLPVECAAAANNCLSVDGDDTSALQIDFASVINTLSMDFGNDDAVFHGGPVWALLQMYLNNVFVADVLMASNNDDIMNQTISYMGAGFDRAVFAYTDANKNRINLIEVVDNIAYGTTRIPEPGTLALVGLALAGLGWARRKA